MSQEKRKGRGRLVPTRPTGVEYRVEYGIHRTIIVRQHGRAASPSAGLQWAKCSIRSSNAYRIPDGSYFLHADEGGVHQLKSIGGKWQFLSLE
jgi:hypothetical protein